MACCEIIMSLAVIIVLVSVVFAVPDQPQQQPPMGSVSSGGGSTDVPTPDGPGTPWIVSGGAMSIARGHSSIFLFNESFVIVGGCLDASCRTQSSAISRYDPLVEAFVTAPTTEIPLFLSIPSPSPVLPPTFVRASIAGPYAVIPVAQTMLRRDEKSLDTVVRPWIVGPCIFYFTRLGNSSEPAVEELYHGVWGLTPDMSAIVNFGRLPSSVPMRANASCQSVGSRIFIIGGVLIDTLVPVDSIDAFDTVTMTYIPNVHRHVEAVMNPGVTIDNAMMYIVGGQRSSNCSSASHAYLWSTPRTHDSSDSSSNDVRESVDFCQSPLATAYYFPEAYLVNESVPLKWFVLPQVPADVLVHSPSPKRGKTRIPPFRRTAEVLRAYSFGGSLTVTSFTSVTCILQIDSLVPGSSSGSGGRRGSTLPSLTRLWSAASWTTQRIEGIHVEQSSLVMFPIPYVFFGVGLALFSFGGVIYTNTIPEEPIMTHQVYQRFTGLSMPGVRGTLAADVPVGLPLDISLQPPTDGYLRISENCACVGNAVGTEDAVVNSSNANDGATTVSFVPLFPASPLYVCFSFGIASIDGTTNQLLFTVVNAFQPFAARLPATASPSDVPVAAANGNSHTIVMAASVSASIAAVLLVAVIVVYRRGSGRSHCFPFRFAHSKGDSESGSVNGSPSGRADDPSNGLLSDRLFNEDSNDQLIRRTTSDSRYKVLKRIGEGAFSSVYLVHRKRDPSQTFAMKFMICADDRERLEAIKECETINTVQAHPSIIRLYDMFMNYEFGGAASQQQDQNNRFDEKDQALLLTSSMHAISIQRTTATRGAADSNLNERTPLVAAGGAGTTPKGAVAGAGTGNTPPAPAAIRQGSSGTTPPAANVHRRFLCLVMEYHPSGDLCRYTLRRAHAIAQERDRRISLLMNKKKSSGGTSDDDLRESFASPKGPSSLSRSVSSAGASSFGGAAFPTSPSSNHAITEPQLLSIAYQVASVLQFLHSQRPPIVHRDLKPENILIRGGTPSPDDPFIPVVVTDFGLAFLQEEHRRSGRGGGTRPYISPESWRGLTSTASDVWSLGCVLYALATQRLTSDTVRVMFQDAKFPDFTRSILSDLIRNHRYSVEFAVFVASILEVEPKKRPTAERLVKMFDVKASREDSDEGYISFKKDAFGPGGAQSLVPMECTLMVGSGLPTSAESATSVGEDETTPQSLALPKANGIMGNRSAVLA